MILDGLADSAKFSVSLLVWGLAPNYSPEWESHLGSMKVIVPDYVIVAKYGREVQSELADA